MALPQIEVPKYTVTLPSTGEDLVMRPYLIKEEKVLLLALESQDPQQIALAIQTLIKNCIETEMEIEKLTNFDIEKLFLELRAVSVGETVTIFANCQHCEEKEEVTINLKEIELTDFDPNAHIIKLTESVGVTMRYPTAELISNLVDVEKLDSIEGLMELIIASVKTIFTEDEVFNCTADNKEETRSFVEGLTTEQFQRIGSFFNSMPTLVHDLEFDCSACEKHNKIELRGLSSFFT